jgi:septal ring-binding cell division protein DamX
MMKDYSLLGIALVILGVVLIVLGAGSALAGANKMDAEAEWKESQTETTCHESYDVDVKNDSVEDVQKAVNNNTRECVTTVPDTNPYSGGQSDIALGAVLMVIGGTSTYFGNKQ